MSVSPCVCPFECGPHCVATTKRLKQVGVASSAANFSETLGGLLSQRHRIASSISIFLQASSSKHLH